MRLGSLCLLLLWGCGSSSVDADTGLLDAFDAGQLADVSIDSGSVDSGSTDAGVADVDPADNGTADTAVADTGQPDSGAVTGFGALSGSCGEIDDELTLAQPFLLENAIDFGMDPYDMEDADQLTDGGREIIRDGNAGGNSLFSEVFSYEVLARCEGAVLLKTETEVIYTDPMGKKTDLLVELDGLKVGVSVTRAVGFPREDPYPPMQALSLLQDKLRDVSVSSANVSPADAWTKQILHVIAYSEDHVQKLNDAYAQLDAATKADTVLLITRSDGDDGFLY